MVKLFIVISLFSGFPTIGSADYNLEGEWLFATPKDINSGKLNSPIVNCNDFFMVSIPKTGTHLMAKLLVMLSGRYPRYMRAVAGANDIQTELDKGKKSNTFLYHHTGNFLGKETPTNDMGTLLTNTAPQITGYVQIIQIRDLRDVFVSLVNYLDKRSPGVWSKSGLTGNATFGDKLTVAISTMLQTDIKNSLTWVNNPNVVVMRFEEVVGPQGGGDAVVQRQAITNLSNALGINLTDEKLQEITKNLFGVSSGPKVAATFHQGQIGSWKKYFTPTHVKLFNDTWGYHQQTLGYPLAE